jgi:hypothetical protein
MFVVTAISCILGTLVFGTSILCIEAIVIIDRVLEELGDIK